MKVVHAHLETARSSGSELADLETWEQTWPILPHGFVRRSEVVPLAVRTRAWNIWGGMFFCFKNLELTPSQNPMDMIDFQEEFSSVFLGSSLN